MALKRELARRVVARLHGETAAEGAAEHFRRVIQEGERPESLPQVVLTGAQGDGIGLLDALRIAFALASNGEARRLVAQGAVQIDEKVERDATRRLALGRYIVRAGRRRFADLLVKV
jgi:tyrosyl-tRNA synthetase